ASDSADKFKAQCLKQYDHLAALSNKERAEQFSKILSNIDKLQQDYYKSAGLDPNDARKISLSDFLARSGSFNLPRRKDFSARIDGIIAIVEKNRQPTGKGSAAGKGAGGPVG